MKILFMVDYWFPKATTNSICAKNIAQELIKKGNEVYVCAFANNKQEDLNDKGIKVSFIKPTLARIFLNKSKENKNKYFARLYRLIGLTLNRTRRILLFPLYPIVSLNLTFRWNKKISKMIKKHNIDCVISVIAPDDSLYAGYLCKKANPSIIWIPYYLDNGSNLLPGSSFEKIKKLLLKKYQSFENRILKKADGIIIMNGHKNYYKRFLTQENKKKLLISDVPLFVVPRKISKKNKNSNDEIWMYAGNMSGKYYDPHTIINTFNEYNKNIKEAFLKLFGPTDKISYINESCINSNIKWYGNVTHETLISEYFKSDILVFYKNGVLDSVSGKFFEYIKYGKIIIYIGNENDINANLVKKYDKGIIIPNMDEKNIKKLISKIKILKEKKVDKNNLLNIYVMSTPEYTAKLIVKIMKGK